MLMTGVWLGPATVLEVDGRRVRVERTLGETWAQMALGYPYQPEPGDVVLAIGDEEVYVIGVLSGRGTAALHVPGDLEIHATGKLSLSGSNVTVAAQDLVHTQAGRVRTVVEGHATLQAERIVEQARKDVKIDGEKIYLG